MRFFALVGVVGLGCALSGALGATPVVPSEGVGGVEGVDHVGLTVTDLEASRALFVDVLGFRVRREEPDYPAYMLTNGVATVTLWRAEDPASAVAFDRRGNVGLHHLALAVDSFATLDALHEQLAARPGVRIEFGPEPAYGGPAKHMMFYEPSGNRIELIHRPAS